MDLMNDYFVTFGILLSWKKHLTLTVTGKGQIRLYQNVPF